MPLNVHEKEHLQTYAQNISWVSQGSFELSSIDPDASGFIHADQGIRLSANNAELIITGQSEATAKNKHTPFIFAAVPKDGNILLNGNHGDPNKFSMVSIGNGSVQAIGGYTGTPSSLLIQDDLIEGIVGIGASPVTHSRISLETAKVEMECNKVATIKMSPTSIELKCGVASIELKATGEITLKAGPTTELNLNALEAKIKALESETKMNAMEIKNSALTLGRDAQLLAKDALILIQASTKAIADIKATLTKNGIG